MRITKISICTFHSRWQSTIKPKYLTVCIKLLRIKWNKDGSEILCPPHNSNAPCDHLHRAETNVILFGLQVKTISYYSIFSRFDDQNVNITPCTTNQTKQTKYYYRITLYVRDSAAKYLDDGSRWRRRWGGSGGGGGEGGS